MSDEILEDIKKILRQTLNLKTTEEIHIDSKLKEDLGLDSMSSLTFLMALEDSIDGFIVDPDNLMTEHLTSVATITRYVNQQLAGNI